ncbi:MAG TPA: HAD family hydrolase [Candidatus Acidoferrales bacterium]|nr:HAD family hydrolase [Candidatus Acidoferrales bacterium]
MADRKTRRAVFLDRDGTLCEEVGYLNHITRLHIFPFVATAVRRLNDAGFPVIVVTNQSGAARGIFPESLIAEVHDRIRHDLAVSGARIDAFYACPHRSEDGCDCRKPRTGLLERAARDHALTLPGSWVVGDRRADVDLARNAGARSVLVLTGYGRGEFEWHAPGWPYPPDFVAEDLGAAVEKILAHESSASAAAAGGRPASSGGGSQ